MDAVDLILGDRWRARLDALAQAARRRGSSPRPADLGAIHDVLDLVIARRNVTEHLDDEALFVLVPDMADMLLAVCDAGHTKAVTEFTNAPWELVLAHHAQSPLLVSCIGVTPPRAVVLHDHPVGAMSLRAALLRALATLKIGLDEVRDALDVAETIARLDGAMHRLETLDFARLATDTSPRRPLEPSTRTRGAVGFDHAVTLSYAFDTSYHGARCAHETPARFDAHALLVRGAIDLELLPRTRARICKTYPLLALYELADTLDTCAPKRPATHREYAAARWIDSGVLRVGDGDDLHDIDIEPEQWASTLRAMAEVMLDHLVRVYPQLGANARFEALRTLFATSDDAASGERAERPARLVPKQESDEEERASFPWSFEDVRALYPHVAWTLTRRGLRSAWAIHTRHGILVPHHAGVSLIEPVTGRARFEHALCSPPCAPPVLVGDSFAIPCEDGRVVWLDEEGGPLADSTAALPFMPLFLHATSAHGALALARDGRRVHVTTSAAAPIGPARVTPVRRLIETRAGSIIVALYDDASVEGIDAEGQRLWWAPGPEHARGRARIAVTEDEVLVARPRDPGTSRTEVTMRDARTGELLWRQTPQGEPRAEPVLMGARALLILERDGQEVLWACAHGEVHWQLTLGDAHPALPATPVPIELDGREDHVLLQTGDGRLRCVDVGRGEVRWSAPSRGPSAWAKALRPVRVRDCALRVADALELRLLKDGELVHSFEGFIHHPEMMLPTGALTVIFGEPRGTSAREDVLYALQFGHFLAVLPPAPMSSD